MTAVATELDEHAYSLWLRGKEAAFEGVFSPRKPTAKSALFLALLDRRGDWLTYPELQRAVFERGVSIARDDRATLPALMPLERLRFALFDLKRTLSNGQHSLALEERSPSERSDRRKAQFRLVPRSERPVSAQASKALLLLEQHHDQISHEIALSLVQGVLPVHAIYHLPRAAATWLVECKRESKKVEHESDAWTAGHANTEDPHALLEFRNALVIAVHNVDGPQELHKRVCVVGLGVGEGQGELGLLEAVMRGPREGEHFDVDYLAIDFSPVLLAAHFQLVQDRFPDEIDNGRLRFIAAARDYNALQSVLGEVRGKATAQGMSDFLSPRFPVLFTMFGNILGNGRENSEDIVIDSLREATSDHPHMSVLLGMAEIDEEDRARAFAQADKMTTDTNADRFFGYKWVFGLLLESARWLAEKRLLAHGREEESPAPAAGSADIIDGFPLDHARLECVPYDTPKLKGVVYRFIYQLRAALYYRGKRDAWAPRASDIVLLSIVKHDIEALQLLFSRMGFRIGYDSGSKDIREPGSPNPKRYRLFELVRTTPPRALTTRQKSSALSSQ